MARHCGRGLREGGNAPEPFQWDAEDKDSADFKLVHGPGTGDARQFREPLRAADIPIVAYDFGMKYNILRRLRQKGFKVQVVPGSTPAAEALKYKPAGIFLSNGPGILPLCHISFGK